MMTPIQIRSVLIDPRRSRIVSSVNQHTGYLTLYPKKGKGWKALFAGVVLVVGAVILGRVL